MRRLAYPHPTRARLPHRDTTRVLPFILATFCQAAQCAIAFQHAGHVNVGGELRLLQEALVIVRGVGGQDHTATGSLDTDALQAGSMAADEVDVDARRDLRIA